MVALLNKPEDLAVSRKVLLMAKARLEKLERTMLMTRQSHEGYLDKFSRADELRLLIDEMERFVNQKERES